MSTKQIKQHLAEAERHFHLALQEAEKQAPPEFFTVHAPHLMEFVNELTSDLARSKRMRVRSLREQGYTLRGLAEFVGMSYQRIQQIETGMTARDRAKEKSGRR